MTRTTLFDPPNELAKLRTTSPITRMRYPDGHIGWLVTSHELARKVLGDPRFSSRNEFRRPVTPLPVAGRDGLRPTLPGALVAMDPPTHSRLRRQLTGSFTVRRVRQLAPRIARIVDEFLTALIGNGQPADLMGGFALPVSSAVICHLLGIGREHRHRIHRATTALVRLDVSTDEAEAARGSLFGFILGLVRSRRGRDDAGPGLIGDLVGGGVLTDDEIAGICFLLLFAGHETTANMICLGTLALIRHPAQFAALRADPSLVDNAVEELLRYLSVVHLGTVRGALDDVDLGGVRIRAGESVCVSLPAANRDPARFAAPDELDLSRRVSGHLAFGFGIHQCLGQQLARLEMRVTYQLLMRRLPTIRLATPVGDIHPNADRIIYGVRDLLAAW